LLGRRDLPLAPDARAGFEMVLLRMLAFKPQGVIDVPTQSLPQSTAQSKPAPVIATPPQISQPAVAPATSVVNAVRQPSSHATTQLMAPVPEEQVIAAPVAARVPPPFDGPYDNVPEMSGDDYDEYAAAPAYLDAGDYNPAPDEVPEPKKFEAPETQANVVEAKPEIAVPPVVHDVPVVVPSALRKVPYEQASAQDWPEIYLGLGVTGILQSTIANCQLVARNGNEFQFIVDENNSTLYDQSHQQRLADLLSNYFIERVYVKIQPGKLTAETPALIAKRHQEERYANAVTAIKTDPIVLQLIEHFGATLREETIQAI
jgi:DNA polymerase-3 subunit gamma/tau